MQEAYCESGIMDADEFTVVQPCDVRLSEYFNVQLASVSTDVETSVENIRQRFEESMLPIYNMIGLNTLKQELEAVFYQVCFNRQRKLLHLPSDDEGTYHMILPVIRVQERLPSHSISERYSMPWVYCRKVKL